MEGIFPKACVRETGREREEMRERRPNAMRTLDTTPLGHCLMSVPSENHFLFIEEEFAFKCKRSDTEVTKGEQQGRMCNPDERSQCSTD